MLSFLGTDTLAHSHDFRSSGVATSHDLSLSRRVIRSPPPYHSSAHRFSVIVPEKAPQRYSGPTVSCTCTGRKAIINELPPSRYTMGWNINITYRSWDTARKESPLNIDNFIYSGFLLICTEKSQPPGATSAAPPLISLRQISISGIQLTTHNSQHSSLLL